MNIINKIRIILPIIILLLLTGCTFSFPFSLSAQKLPTKVISEQQFIEKIQTLDAFSTPTIFERTHSGFNINRKVFIDNDGTIEDVKFNKITGFANYLVQISKNNYLLKVMQTSSAIQPLIVANITFNKNIWNIHTITGQDNSGKTLILGSKGFLLINIDGSALIYDYIRGYKSITISDQYQIVKFQNGDITETKLILLKSLIAKHNTDTNDFFDLIKTFGTYLGIGITSDYFLMNMETGKLTNINIQSDGSPIKQCLKYTGRWVNRECIKYSNPINPLSTDLEWINSKSGVIVITLEKDLTQIYATNLTTGEKVLLKNSITKCQGFNLEVDLNKKINIIMYFNANIDTIKDIETKM